MTTQDEDYQYLTGDPDRRALIAVLWLTLVSLPAALAVWGLHAGGLVGKIPLIVILGWTGLCGAITLGVWLWGHTLRRRAAAFLAGERPLVRWTYAMPEWEQLKEATWAEEQGDWKLQLGCLSVLFAITGLLTGFLVGLEEGFPQAVGGAGIGLVGGGIVGGVIGAVVAVGNHLSARWAYAQSTPGEVALGRDEVYAFGNYFRGNGRSSFVRRATLHRGVSPRLHIEIQLPPRLRASSVEEWVFPVPSQMCTAVEAILTEIVATKRIP